MYYEGNRELNKKPRNTKPKIQWNPVNTVTNGPKKLAVLTGWGGRINEGFFFNKKQFLNAVLH